jgi:hypothetical protein
MKTGVPESIQFQTKPEIALDQIRRARERGIPQGVVLADAGYGTDTKFRAELTTLEMAYEFVNLIWPHFDHFIWPHLRGKVLFLSTTAVSEGRAVA